MQNEQFIDYFCFSFLICMCFLHDSWLLLSEGDKMSEETKKKKFELQYIGKFLLLSVEFQESLTTNSEADLDSRVTLHMSRINCLCYRPFHFIA